MNNDYYNDCYNAEPIETRLKRENAELKAENNRLRNNERESSDYYNELLNEKYKLEQEVSRLTQAIVNIALKI